MQSVPSQGSLKGMKSKPRSTAETPSVTSTAQMAKVTSSPSPPGHGFHLVVIGGGAAGFFGAIAAAEAYPHHHVTLLEAGRSPLAKVAISGGGRCNVTHACFDPRQLVQRYPRGSKALLGAFSRFQPQDTVAWYTQRGVALKTEADGRMFPVSDRAETIIECLEESAAQAGVRVRTGALVQQVEVLDSQFSIELKSGEWLRGDRLLLATGSHPVGYRIARQLGHRLEPPVPSLFTFNIRDSNLHDLAGIAVDPVQIKLWTSDSKPIEQSGALLVTHWGLSGPAILKLSAWGARLLHASRYQATIQINWLPGETPDPVYHRLVHLKSDQPRRAIANFEAIPLPRRLWGYLLQRANLDPTTRGADLSKKSLRHLATELTQGRYSVSGKGVFKEEFVTCGGVALAEVNFKTMESRRCPGLYFAGEILDIDGITGGFNFQSAWTTGWIAGQSMGA
jgi:predicted Rossmann fold flavoprotein